MVGEHYSEVDRTSRERKQKETVDNAEELDTAPSGGLSRRHLLQVGGVVAVGAVMGCGPSSVVGDAGPSDDAGVDSDVDASDADARDADRGGDSFDADYESDVELIDGDDSVDAEIDVDVDIDGGPDVPGPVFLLHLTDLHLGVMSVSAQALEHALHEVAPLARPGLTVATGDLVDEGYEDPLWEEYRRVVGDATMDDLFEIPGNHDSHYDTPLRRYLENSVTGRATGRLYGQRVYERAQRRIRVVGINSASHGTRLGNLTGVLGPEQVDELLASIAADPTPVDVTIVAGHHPMLGVQGLEVMETHDNLARLLAETRASAYLCGHVHLLDLAWHDRVLHVQGPTLGKPSAISDHGYFIIGYDDLGLSVKFVELEVAASRASTPWPVVMITRPVDARLGGGNPVDTALPRGTSGHLLRAGVFCPGEPDDVAFRINSSSWIGMTRRWSWYEAEFETDDGEELTIEVRALADGRFDTHEIHVRLAT